MIVVAWSVSITEMSSCIVMPNMKVFIKNVEKKRNRSTDRGFVGSIDGDITKKLWKSLVIQIFLKLPNLMITLAWWENHNLLDISSCYYLWHFHYHILCSYCNHNLTNSGYAPIGVFICLIFNYISTKFSTFHFWQQFFETYRGQMLNPSEF